MWALAATALVVGIAANLPATTTVAVDGRSTTSTVPAYRKLLAFIDRDLQMHGLAEGLVAGRGRAIERLDALLEWVHRNIRPVPPGYPIVDDHPWHVVVRGYGTFDQAADVLATLTTYVGMPGTLVFVRDDDGGIVYAFTLVELDGAWRVVDAREGRALGVRTSGLATLDELRDDATLTVDLPAPAEAGGRSYAVLLRSIDPLPDELRAYDQQPTVRLVREIRRAIFGR